jgi:sialic acid synthase SpsE
LNKYIITIGDNHNNVTHTDEFQINGEVVSPEDPYTIAEMGTNHDGKKTVAKKLIDTAATAGADAIKYQVYHAGDIVSKNISAKEYGFEEYYDAETAYEVFDEHLRLPRSWFGDLTEYASKQGLDNIATVHCPDCADFVADFDIQAFKVASMDLTHLPLLESLISYDLPIILSTGMASLAEIDTSVSTLRANDHDNVAVLHCVSNYPTDPSELNLRNIPMIQDALNIPVGFSDHTLSTLAPALAVVHGASIIEKHLTLNRERDGPDHPFALEPNEFEALVENINFTIKSPGKTSRMLTDSNKRSKYRRSIISDTDIAAGETITEDSIRFARPGGGIEPKHIDTILGMTLQTDVSAEQVLKWQYFQ